MMLFRSSSKTQEQRAEGVGYPLMVVIDWDEDVLCASEMCM